MIELLKGHEEELTDLMDEFYFDYDTLYDERSLLDSDPAAISIIYENIDEIREKITLELKELGVNQVTIDDIFRNAGCYVNMRKYWDRKAAGEVADEVITEILSQEDKIGNLE